MQPGCAWPSSTYRRGCTGKERTSGLQACNLGVNGRKNVLCVHPRKVSEVRFERQLRIIFTYCVMLQHQVQIAITTLETICLLGCCTVSPRGDRFREDWASEEAKNRLSQAISYN